MLVCKVCGAERNLGRRYCIPCGKKADAERASRSYYTVGHTVYILNCKACLVDFNTVDPRKPICDSCRALIRTINPPVINNNYIYNPKIWKITGQTLEHRGLAEILLGRKLLSSETVHHIDDNSKNNLLYNLLVIKVAQHNLLHSALNIEKVICYKQHKFYDPWLWTIAWLSANNIPHIPLWKD